MIRVDVTGVEGDQRVFRFAVASTVGYCWNIGDRGGFSSPQPCIPRFFAAFGVADWDWRVASDHQTLIRQLNKE
jgi:hypothetical protein